MAHKTYNEGIVYDNTVFANKTANFTSSGHLCAGAKSVALFYTGEGTVTDRTGTLQLEVSPDGSNFYDYNLLIDNTPNTNTQDLTRVDSVQRIADGTDIVFFEPKALGSINYFRGVLTVDDSGTGSPAGNFDLRAVVQY